MRDLLSKERYPYKILTLLMKSSGYLAFSIDNTPYMDYPRFLQKNIDLPPSMIFQKYQPPVNKVGVFIKLGLLFY